MYLGYNAARTLPGFKEGAVVAVQQENAQSAQPPLRQLTLGTIGGP
jgi:hypothetical protein